MELRGCLAAGPPTPLAFVPYRLIGDPEPVKAALRERYGELARELRPEVLLLAHGEPVVSGGAPRSSGSPGRASPRRSELRGR